MEDPLNINSKKVPCRLCEVFLSILLLVPLVTFSLFSFIKPDSGFWILLSIIAGLPLAYVSIKILFLSERSRRMGLLPPWVLYAFGILSVIFPFFAPKPIWASFGIELHLVHAAHQRQITRRQIRATSFET